MCFQVIERFSVCNCVYHTHAVDACSAYGQRSHAVQERIVLVGYACTVHAQGLTLSSSTVRESGAAADASIDSGYSSSSKGEKQRGQDERSARHSAGVPGCAKCQQDVLRKVWSI